MKIDIYTLLGLIKDGKAPKKIKIDNDVLTLSKTNIIQYNFERYGQLNWDYYIENYRLDEKIVEILDKDFKLEEEKKIPEKLDEYADVSGALACEWSFAEKKLKDKINEVIDYLDYLKSKG